MGKSRQRFFPSLPLPSPSFFFFCRFCTLNLCMALKLFVSECNDCYTDYCLDDFTVYNIMCIEWVTCVQC